MAAGPAHAGLGPALIGLEKTGVEAADEHIAAVDGHHVLPQSGVAQAEIGLSGGLAFVVHPADHGQAHPVVLLGGLHVHAEHVGVGQKGAQGLVQRLVDGDEAAEVLDADLDVVPVVEI